jgi:DNA modification methylase
MSTKRTKSEKHKAGPEGPTFSITKRRPVGVAVEQAKPTAADPADVLRIEMRPVASLTAHPANYRRHPPDQIEVLRRSIRAHGLQKPVVIKADGTMLAGHGLVEAARLEGYSQVPVHVYTGKHAEAFLIADNFSAQLAVDDEPALAALLKRLAADDELAASGYTDDDLGSLIAKLEMEDAQRREETFDAPAALEATPEGPTRVQPAELWQLGRHRLLCGDCTLPENWERLMGGEVAHAISTDPPYGVNYRGQGTLDPRSVGGATARRAHGSDTNERPDAYWDEMTPEQYRALVTGALSLSYTYSDDAAPLYVWFASARIRELLAALDEIGWQDRNLICWAKNNGTGSLFAQYKPWYEPVYYCFKRGKTPRWYGDTTQRTLWEHDKPLKNEGHPTIKPLALIERTIVNSTEPGMLVVDAFLGSGTAIIAAERTGRRCYGFELDPRYCSVILARWEEFTQREAVRIDD